jgi:hypothetical protein
MTRVTAFYLVLVVTAYTVIVAAVWTVANAAGC